jgi:hypothetical protein
MSCSRRFFQPSDATDEIPGLAYTDDELLSSLQGGPLHRGISSRHSDANLIPEIPRPSRSQTPRPIGERSLNRSTSHISRSPIPADSGRIPVAAHRDGPLLESNRRMSVSRQMGCSSGGTIFHMDDSDSELYAGSDIEFTSINSSLLLELRQDSSEIEKWQVPAT